MVTYCAQEFRRVFWLDLNRPPREVVVVALVASRMPRAFTQ
nr:Uncharacterised protein [Klebsiella pneumoniae]